jgi:Nif-specific regulatory protein
LYEIGILIAQSPSLKQSLVVLLRAMQQHMRIVRGTVSLYDRNSGSLYLHESFGWTEEQKPPVVYRLGEGATAPVVESGKAMALPGVAGEPEDAQLSLLCAPIVLRQKILGTITVERACESDFLPDFDVKLIGVIAAMMAQTVEIYLLENVDRLSLINENRRLHHAVNAKFHPANIIGKSKGMREVYVRVERAARTKSAILILGESGTGKQLVANAIHSSDPSRNGPLVQVNCPALPESILESELFGQERTASTGSADFRKGRFEEANGGTIFLDEVGELPSSTQAKILRALKEKTLVRVGGDHPVKVDVRVIAATTRNLAQMVEEGEFREDLFRRLNVFPIAIPPLRDRACDIVALADHFVERYSKETGKEIKRISTPALNMMMGHHWPGNVRELENVIERAIIQAEDGVIHGYNLPPSLQPPVASATAPKGDLDQRLAVIEYEMIVDALKAHGGNMTEAARALGLTRRILGLRMQKYGASYKDYRVPGGKQA